MSPLSMSCFYDLFIIIHELVVFRNTFVVFL
nr:MAG TPA: hypothetical protein [Caudoviricetes sp.]